MGVASSGNQIVNINKLPDADKARLISAWIKSRDAAGKWLMLDMRKIKRPK